MSMTRLTTAHKKEIAGMLSAPMRYRELRTMLLAYMIKTPYKVLSSFEDALVRDQLLYRFDLSSGLGVTTALYASVPVDQWTSYQVAQASHPNGYFCNLTSIYYHSLTNQVPSTIYVGIEAAREKDASRARHVTLSDHAIFDAFVQPHRVSKHECRFQDHEIIVTERVSSACLGVEVVRASDRVCPKGSRVTSLERALIDAVVHPQYNGGLGTVVDAFRVGIPRVDHSRFVALYDKLAYVYPYWQAIGFLCERIGSGSVAMAFRKKYPLKNKFYLDHLAKTSWSYDASWQIYFPKGFI